MYVLFILLEMREFLLIEFSERTAFEQVFLCIVKLSAEPLPKEGGMLDEKRTITLPNRALMHEVSYRGDLDGWRRAIQSFCKTQGLLWAHVECGRVIMCDGVAYALDDCIVRSIV